MDLLEKGLRHLGIYDREKTELLHRYIGELTRWNSRFNLVRAEGEGLIIRHILDSLAACSRLAELDFAGKEEKGSGDRTVRIADLGSGAGLPGIPLAIWMDGYAFTLIEKSEKRCGFLRNAIAVCRLHHCSVICSEIEHITEHYHCCLFRALGNFQDLAPKVHSLLYPGGWMAAYKGKREKVESEISSLPAVWKDCEVFPLEVPFLDEERNVLLLRRG